MSTFYWIQIGLNICFLTILVLLKRYNSYLKNLLDILPTWEAKEDKTLYGKLCRANISIEELKKENKKLKIALSIKTMNDTLEREDY